MPDVTSIMRLESDRARMGAVLAMIAQIYRGTWIGILMCRWSLPLLLRFFPLYQPFSEPHDIV